MTSRPHTGDDHKAAPDGLPAALAGALRDPLREVAASRAANSSVTIADGSARVLPSQLVIEPTAATSGADAAAAAVLDLLLRS